MGNSLEGLLRDIEKIFEICENEIAYAFEKKQHLKIEDLKNSLKKEPCFSEQDMHKLISIYLNRREDIEVRVGRLGGIYPKGVHIKSSEIDPSLLDDIINSFNDITSVAFASQNKVLITQVAKEIADKIKIISSHKVYLILSNYIKNSRPDLIMKHGKGAGLFKA
jgi:hypothetical protein